MAGNMLYKKASIKDVSTRSLNTFIIYTIFYIIWNLAVIGTAFRFIPHYYWFYTFDLLEKNDCFIFPDKWTPIRDDMT